MDKHRNKRARIDFSIDVTVLVGPKEEKFTVHKDAITKCSLFFNAACSREWQEARSRVVKLPEHDGDTFSTYLHWVYTGKIALGKSLRQIGIRDGKIYSEYLLSDRQLGKIESMYEDLVAMYALCAYLRDERAQNACVDEFIYISEKSDTTPGCPTIEAVYGKSMDDTPLNALLVDYYCRPCEGYKFDDMEPGEFTKFLARISKLLVRAAAGVGPPSKFPCFEDRCRYHIHEHGVRCASE